MKVAFVSLGCAKNLVNTEQMMALCRNEGWIVTGDPVGADVAVLNTCGFIEGAKTEAIDNILELAQLKENGQLKKLIVAGCLSQRYRDEILEELPEIDGLLGTGSYTDVVEAVKAVMEDDIPTYFGDIHHTIEDGDRMVSTPSYTAYLKIAEGCDNCCAYCIIPRLRGRFRSRTIESLVAEAKKLADDGVKELMVIAQDITRYGTDWDGKHHLAELLNELCKLDFKWIRLHYLYPDEFDDELIEVIANQPKIIKYLDIPLQHCNDAILERMNRRGTKAEILELLAKLRAKMPDLVLRTSLIVGLPGETEEAFEELCDFLRETKIQRAGVFQFSPEEGTAAAIMPDQVPAEIAERRVELLVDIQSRVMDEWNEERLGHEMEVLCEGFDSTAGCYAGRSYADSPDIDGRVLFTAAGLIPAGTFVKVRITDVVDGDLMGEFGRMNTANKLTMLRVLLIPIFLISLYFWYPASNYVALIIFIAASITDYIDGYIARHYNQTTDFGKFMDPLADKLLVVAAMMWFAELGKMPLMVIFVVLVREFAVSGMRMVASDKGRVIAAGWSGKVKTASTMVCLCLMFLPIPNAVNTVCWVVILATTVYSGLEYFIKNADVFKGAM